MEDRNKETVIAEMTEETVHQMFGEVWNAFNAARKSGGSYAGWQAFHDEGGRIAKKYPGRLSKELILSIMDEAEEEMAEPDPAARQIRYRETAKAFQESWLLYQSLKKDLDVNTVQAYCHANPQKFGQELGAAVYKAACGIRYTKGSFAKDAFDFYLKYKDGGLPDPMLKDFEDMVNHYPGYMLQMMKLYEELNRLQEEKYPAPAA